MPVVGYRRLSLEDYPGRLCATAYVAGCNFRCPYCTNVDLVLNHLGLREIPEAEVLNHLYRVRGYLSGLCLSGGEPTLHNGLLPFVYKVKSLGYGVKIDSNGTRPRRLRKLMEERLIDYVTLDVKAPLDRYSEVVRAKVDVKSVEESIRLLRRGGVDHEFRTTAIPGLIGGEELEEIAKTLVGSKRFVIQRWRPGETMCPDFSGVEPYSVREMEGFMERVRHYFSDCVVRL